MYRNNRIRKAIAISLSLVFLENIFCLPFTLALTSGMHQPEFVAYDAGGNSNMVNPLTGNFSHSIPAISVPGPAGGFSIPLSYNAGISNEQMASWVGLGWSLNAGAIVRTVAGFPDDFSGESYHMKATDPGTYGYTARWRITNNAILGPIGPIINWLASAHNGYSYTSNGYTLKIKSGFSKVNWEVFLDAEKDENMYGALYQQNLKSKVYSAQPYIHKGSFGGSVEQTKIFYTHGAEQLERVASDMHMLVAGKLEEARNPVSIAYDSYSVMGGGVSGSIIPYRHDVGSLAFPASPDAEHHRLNPVPFKNYKVNFKYENELASNYKHHIGTDAADTQNELFASLASYRQKQYGISYSSQDPFYPGSNEPFVNWILQDPTLYQDAKRMEADREGLKNNQLVAARVIKWYSNTEINDNSASGAVANGFMDFLPKSEDRSTGIVKNYPIGWLYSESARNFFRPKLPQNGIGGFSITGADGVTYHFALPVYNKRQYNWARSGNATNSSEMNAPYATMWLLTAITGPDFVDRGKADGTGNGVVDEEDYGYWVKFEYGRFATEYKWRSPYWGLYTDMNGIQFSEGLRETYYLNSISTKTHTALFIKSLRKDGKSAYYWYEGDPNQEPLSAQTKWWNKVPSSSLRLDEIILLNNEDYESLITPVSLGGKYGIHPSIGNAGGITNGDTYTQVWDGSDFNGSGVRDYIKAHQLQRTQFNYSYDLCKGTLNSFDWSSDVNAWKDKTETPNYSNKGGKLTLTGISVYGRNDIKAMPDYKFEYGDNADYHKDNFDAWGMYKNTCSDLYTSPPKQQCDLTNETRIATSKGSQWSLTKITAPGGAVTEITYERDDYSSVSGYDAEILIPINEETYNIATGNVTWEDQGDLTNYFTNGQTVEILATFWTTSGAVTFTQSQQISSLTSNSFHISNPPTLPANSSLKYYVPGSLLRGKVKKAKPGGDIRVSLISISDEKGNKYKTRYIYTKDGRANGVSSGVCSQEPEEVMGRKYDFYDLYDYPTTPVMYGKVTVLSGKLSTDDEYITRSETNFIMPHYSMVRKMEEQIYHAALGGGKTGSVMMYSYNIGINTVQIGQPVSSEEYSRRDNLIRRTEYKYLSGESGKYNHMGEFTEGTLLCQNIRYLGYQLYRTTKVTYPTILESVAVTEKGLGSTTKNTVFDFLTGSVLETETENSFGEKYRTQTVPAYKKYSSLGSKVDNNTNKNLFTLSAGNYLYTWDDEKWKVISASAQTFNNSWNYREYNASLKAYADATRVDIWRGYRSFAYKSLVGTKGVLLNNAGSAEFNFANDDFDWNGTVSANEAKGWQMTSEITRFDHDSHQLEVKDVNGNFASAKAGARNDESVASVSHANFSSCAYTGFENIVTPAPGVTFFDSEVTLGTHTEANLVQKSADVAAHTGKYVAKVDPCNNSTHFGPGYYVKYVTGGTDNIERGRTYRASVWVHNSSPNDAKLVAHLTGTSEGSGAVIDDYQSMSKNSVDAVKAGDWTLLTVNITVPADYISQGGLFNDLRIYLWNAGATAAYFDDLRFHPVDAPIVTRVFDEATGQLVAEHDNENFATVYRYDLSGRLVETKREFADKGSQKGGLMIMSDQKYNYSRK